MNVDGGGKIAGNSCEKEQVEDPNAPPFAGF
jgi:hypothetical protein